jgi:hypothetical protein
MMKRTTLGLLTSVAMLCSTISLAQREHVDHEATAIQRNELRCANTAGKPVPAEIWVACVKASDVSEHNYRATSIGPITKTATRAGTNSSPSGTAKSSERNAHHGEVRHGVDLPATPPPPPHNWSPPPPPPPPPNHPWLTPIAAPEIDWGTTGSALILLAGTVAILRGKRKA